MTKKLDDYVKSLTNGVTGVLEMAYAGTSTALETVQKGAHASLDAVNKTAAMALEAVQKSMGASIEAVELLSEIRGRPLAVLNGVVGDTLAAQNSKYAIEMKLIGEKHGGRICIFVHGLCASDKSWQVRVEPSQSYGSLLEQDCGYTPIYVRYNSGLHISTNGQRLAQLLNDLYKRSSIPIQEIIFIGHSMGGLVVRSACYYGQKMNAPWISKVRKIFFLGTPHSGNDYEKLGNLASTILELMPTVLTRGLAKLGNRRSAGIKDLRFGYLLDEDWLEQDPDALLQDNRHPVPLLKGVDYYIIAGSVAKESDNIFAQYLGDGVVPTLIAAGESVKKSKTIPFPHKHFKIIRGVSHARLTRNPEVYKQIRKWCREKLRRRKTEVRNPA